MSIASAHVTEDEWSWLPDPPPRRYPLYQGERAVLRARPEQNAAEWAQGNRYVHVSPMPGPLDLDVTPHMRGILETWSLEWTREIFIAGGSQGAKSDTGHNCIGYSVEHEPGPALIGMQDRTTGSEIISERVIPMFRDTPTLRRLLTGNPDDVTHTRVRLRNSSVIYLAWSNSEGRLASKPVKYLHLDEVDLWPEASIRKARARWRAYQHHGGKIIETCTTSSKKGRIWSARKLADECREYFARCPHCGHMQTLQFGRIQWDKEILDPVDVKRPGSAWYECENESCGVRWDEEDRNQAVLDGEWRVTAWNGKVRVLRPERVWFHVVPLLSQFVSFGDIAAAYLEMLAEPTRANTVYFWNDCLGLPIPDEEEEHDLPTEAELYKRREAYAPEGEPWQVPMRAVVITADCDVQGDRIECEVVAWGPGDESWGLEYRVFHGDPRADDPYSHEEGVFAQVRKYVMEARFLHESGAVLPIALSGIDINFSTDQVGKFARSMGRRMLAHRGSPTRGLPFVPRRKTKGGRHRVPHYELGTEAGKDLLFAWLGIAKEGRKYCHFPTGYDFDWFRMLCAEAPVTEKDSKGRTVTVWKVREGYQRNEALDIRVGNMAVREILNPQYDALAKNLERQAEAIRRERGDTFRRTIAEAAESIAADENDVGQTQLAKQLIEMIAPEKAPKRRQAIPQEESSVRDRPSWFRR